MKHAGIHLSGPLSPKTAVAIAEVSEGHAPIELRRLYEKLGTLGTQNSDDRLVEILLQEHVRGEVVVDAPLSLPPCVVCRRAVCPGTARCEDTAVTYMEALRERWVESAWRGAEDDGEEGEGARKPKAGGRRLRRPTPRRQKRVNPQGQRLWDVYAVSMGLSDHVESSFSGNWAPLVVRARTLQKRLRGMTPPVELRETSPHRVVDMFARHWGWGEGIWLAYRQFEDGAKVRRRFLLKMAEGGGVRFRPEHLKAAVQSVEVFQALVGAVMGAARARRQTIDVPAHYPEPEAWLLLPELSRWF